jgi:hypothetical protein
LERRGTQRRFAGSYAWHERAAQTTAGMIIDPANEKMICALGQAGTTAIRGHIIKSPFNDDVPILFSAGNQGQFVHRFVLYLYCWAERKVIFVSLGVIGEVGQDENGNKNRAIVFCYHDYIKPVRRCSFLIGNFCRFSYMLFDNGLITAKDNRINQKLETNYF